LNTRRGKEATLSPCTVRQYPYSLRTMLSHLQPNESSLRCTSAAPDSSRKREARGKFDGGGHTRRHTVHSPVGLCARSLSSFEHRSTAFSHVPLRLLPLPPAPAAGRRRLKLIPFDSLYSFSSAGQSQSQFPSSAADEGHFCVQHTPCPWPHWWAASSDGTPARSPAVVGPAPFPPLSPSTISPFAPAPAEL